MAGASPERKKHLFTGQIAGADQFYSISIFSQKIASIWPFFGKDLISVDLSVFVFRYGNNEQSIDGHLDTSPC